MEIQNARIANNSHLIPQLRQQATVAEIGRRVQAKETLTDSATSLIR